MENEFEYKAAFLKQDMLMVYSPSICSVIYKLPPERKKTWAEKKYNDYLYKIVRFRCRKKGWLLIFAFLLGFIAINALLIPLAIFCGEITALAIGYLDAQILILAFTIISDTLDTSFISHVKHKGKDYYMRY
jgi:hypothetical protein